MTLQIAPPTACQWGHPLTWLLAPGHAYADGEGLATCPCALRKHDGRTVRGASTPVLWRWVPNQPRALRPIFLSQNRLAFALAVRMEGLASGTQGLVEEVVAAKHQADYLRALTKRAQRALRRLEAADLAVRGPDGA